MIVLVNNIFTYTIYDTQVHIYYNIHNVKTIYNSKFSYWL